MLNAISHFARPPGTSFTTCQVISSHTPDSLPTGAIHISGLRPRIALSSAQVLPGWTTSTPPCQNFSSDGDIPLTTCLSPGVHFEVFERPRYADNCLLC